MANKWLPSWGDRSGDVEHFRGFKTQIDSLFEDWFGRSMGGVLAPRLDVAEDDKAVTISAEPPGVKENEIEVSLVAQRKHIPFVVVSAYPRPLVGTEPGQEILQKPVRGDLLCGRLKAACKLAS
jgi:HSP20 family molecular chaperone IbpA